MASPSVGDPALKYGDINAVTPSTGEVKGLINSEKENIGLNENQEIEEKDKIIFESQYKNQCQIKIKKQKKEPM